MKTYTIYTQHGKFIYKNIIEADSLTNAIAELDVKYGTSGYKFVDIAASHIPRMSDVVNVIKFRRNK